MKLSSLVELRSGELSEMGGLEFKHDFKHRSNAMFCTRDRQCLSSASADFAMGSGWALCWVIVFHRELWQAIIFIYTCWSSNEITRILPPSTLSKPFVFIALCRWN